MRPTSKNREERRLPHLERLGQRRGQILLGIPILWLLLGILLHAGSWLAGGENGIVPSFGVALWGIVPSLAGGIVAVGVLYFTFDPITVTPANQDTVFETAKRSFRVLDSKLLIVPVLTAAWTAVIWRFGLEYWKEISRPAAWTVAGSVAAILVGMSLP